MTLIDPAELLRLVPIEARAALLHREVFVPARGQWGSLRVAIDPAGRRRVYTSHGYDLLAVSMPGKPRRLARGTPASKCRPPGLTAQHALDHVDDFISRIAVSLTRRFRWHASPSPKQPGGVFLDGLDLEVTVDAVGVRRIFFAHNAQMLAESTPGSPYLPLSLSRAKAAPTANNRKRQSHDPVINLRAPHSIEPKPVRDQSSSDSQARLG